MIDHRELAERSVPIEATEPTDSTDSAEPMDATERIDPTDPIESTDPFEAMQRKESSDQSDKLALEDFRTRASSHDARRPRAGDGNRTRMTSLEGWDSAIELHPQSGRGDLNPRPCAPKAHALPDCATPRVISVIEGAS